MRSLRSQIDDFTFCYREKMSGTRSFQSLYFLRFCCCLLAWTKVRLLKIQNCSIWTYLLVSAFVKKVMCLSAFNWSRNSCQIKLKDDSFKNWLTFASCVHRRYHPWQIDTEERDDYGRFPSPIHWYISWGKLAVIEGFDELWLIKPKWLSYQPKTILSSFCCSVLHVSCENLILHSIKCLWWKFN